MAIKIVITAFHNRLCGEMEFTRTVDRDALDSEEIDDMRKGILSSLAKAKAHDDFYQFGPGMIYPGQFSSFEINFYEGQYYGT